MVPSISSHDIGCKLLSTGPHRDQDQRLTTSPQGGQNRSDHQPEPQATDYASDECKDGFRKEKESDSDSQKYTAPDRPSTLVLDDAILAHCRHPPENLCPIDSATKEPSYLGCSFSGAHLTHESLEFLLIQFVCRPYATANVYPERTYLPDGFQHIFRIQSAGQKYRHWRIGDDSSTHRPIMNTACSAVFSSDRTIKEYAEDIWEIKPLI